MTVGIDFDGVIANWTKLKSLYVKKLYDLEIRPEHARREFLVASGILTEQQYFALQEAAVRAPVDLLEPVDDALLSLRRLSDKNIPLLVITTRTELALERAREWATAHGLALDFTGVGFYHTKREAARGLTVYVDDELEKIEPLADLVPYRFLFSWEYNMYDKTGGIAQRVFSWKELYEKICGLAYLEKR